MSASVGDGNGQDVDLNLAPIIDCFTVLITYLLVTASFITLASVDVSVSATNPSSSAAPPPPSDAPPPITMALELKATGEVGIQLRGGKLTQAVVITVPPVNGVWDPTSLTAKLEEIQRTYTGITDANVSAEPNVIYKDMVNVLHEIQATMPKVYISG